MRKSRGEGFFRRDERVVRNEIGGAASLSESGLAGFSGFRFVQLAGFDISGDSAKTNMDERLRVFVRIRISGIFRISIRPIRGLWHNRRSRQDRYGGALANQSRAGKILIIL